MVYLSLLLLPFFALCILGVQAFARMPFRAWWAVHTVTTVFLCSFLYIAGVWSASSIWLRYALVVLLVPAVAWSAVNARRLPWWRRPRWYEWAVMPLYPLFIAITAAGAISGIAARVAPPGAIELELPLGPGTYCVGNGGNSLTVNLHQVVALPGFEVVRGQLYALDMVKLGPFGNRAAGILPAATTDYRIFGEPLYAPCDGIVESLRDGLPDLTPPRMDPVNAPGNHVIIHSGGGGYIVLAHMKQGSIKVIQGQSVKTGDVLGAVGNSGNTSEPHLHIHAQNGPGGWTGSDADAIPILFKGRFLARGDIARN